MEGWYPNGQKHYEFYSLGQLPHREDGPVYVEWYPTGQKRFETWSLNGKLHREDGPAFHKCAENGDDLYKHFYLNGVHYSHQQWIEKLKEMGSLNK